MRRAPRPRGRLGNGRPDRLIGGLVMGRRDLLDNPNARRAEAKGSVAPATPSGAGESPALLITPSRREQSSADAVTSLLLSDSCASGAGQVETAPFVEEQKSGEARARTLLSQESGRARAVCQLGPSRRPDVAAPPKRRPPAPLIVTQLPGLFSQRRAGAPRRREGRRRAAPPPRDRCGRPARASRR